MTLGKKIGTGFGIVIIMLVILGAISFTGVGEIVKNASEVINGRTLDGELAQKEVDHLNWIVELNKLITDDDVNELHVETDHTKCGLGKWLYGEGRKQAEAIVPSLAPLLKDIEEPHRLLHESAISIAEVYNEADPGLPEFLAHKEIEHLEWASAIQEAILENTERLETQTDHTRCGLGKWLYSEEGAKTARSDTVLASLLQEIKDPHQKLHETAKDIISAYRQVHPGLLDTLRLRLDDHRKWAANIATSLIDGSQINVQTDPEKCQLGIWVASEDMKKLRAADPKLNGIFKALKEPHDALHKSAVSINDAIRMGDKIRAESIFKNKTAKYLEECEKFIDQAIQYEKILMDGRDKAISIFKNESSRELKKTQEILRKLMHRSNELLQGKRKASEIFARQTTPNLQKVQKFLGEARKEAADNILTDKAMLAAAQGTKRNVAIVAVAAILAGLFLAFIIARGIINILVNISSGLNEGANQVAAASSQVSSASQSLAEGSSEQAASIEETSSSLEEMSSMTKKNAANSAQADRLMKDADQIVKQANASMGELTRSIDEISKASEETQKIIKTIDEIAFQTNLLALNAAVEAARAGEAGAGFAVVAEEVRNLAMRSADAAKNTAELIEGTVKKVNDGSELVHKTNEAFKEVGKSVSRGGDLVGEISAASDEQASGIEQVNIAVTEMDKVIQQNAANAEESASASEELNAQAEQMKDYVSELVAMVGGSQDTKTIRTSRSTRKIVTGGKKNLRISGHSKSVALEKRKEINPDEIIPMHDDDFTDF